MENAAILLIIWGILVVFAGIYVYTGHSDIFSRRHSVRNDPAYLKYLGNKIIIAGFAIIFFAVVLSFLKLFG